MREGKKLIVRVLMEQSKFLILIIKPKNPKLYNQMSVKIILEFQLENLLRKEKGIQLTNL